jgi:hypothetical protein
MAAMTKVSPLVTPSQSNFCCQGFQFVQTDGDKLDAWAQGRRARGQPRVYLPAVVSLDGLRDLSQVEFQGLHQDDRKSVVKLLRRAALMEACAAYKAEEDRMRQDDDAWDLRVLESAQVGCCCELKWASI